MSRTTLLKGCYALIAVSAFFAGFYAVAAKVIPSTTAAVVAAAILLIPGRIVGYVWRDFLRGKRDTDAKRWDEAIPLFESFLNRLKKTPSIGWLIWLSPSMYTVSADAMVKNNLGVCHLEMGRLSPAKEQLLEALKMDHLYPFPHQNLAIVAALEKDETAMQHHASEARRLGYTGSSIDKILEKSKEIYARLEPASYVRPPAVQER
ncbi:hypothetical protein DES53_12610 [Roseimicrobium gellanilyticum]|uniref:Tetratricopeptide repeat protein n=1 Tax=Roseimicrobium gellanilyticum TaxID=748857 RepID=A0A366H087_9BACT|nr:hypothetical protein [Roseimicrobium gellanilyticum]RBP35134.1 hypothetical protein DES53_12610 [Roseimicrobium gellanilyticum]